MTSRDERVRRAIDTAARRVPMPPELTRRLQAIARPAEAASPAPAAPKAPLPPELRRRLQGIARREGVAESHRRPLPQWLASPRWAVAASGVLALLLGGLAGGPDGVGRYVTAASASAGGVARTVGSMGGKTLLEIEERVETTWEETRGKLPLDAWNVDQIPLAGEILRERSEPDERRPE